MKAGDIVRFKSPAVARATFRSVADLQTWVWRLGLLVEYHPWEKIATILYEGKTLRCRAEHVQKAGKRDGLTDEGR